ncbi:MAG TPA: VOC family protein [Nitrococcus sp.]|nr:VOC family protein [Nitrococcus sp.]
MLYAPGRWQRSARGDCGQVIGSAESCGCGYLSQPKCIIGRVAAQTAKRGFAMAIQLDHTIVPAHDKVASAKFFARIFGLSYAGEISHFAPVKVNDTLTLDFDNDSGFESHHYAFKVSEAEFDQIFQRIRDEGIAYGSGPRALDDMNINQPGGGRGVYFRDPNGHIFELLTA